MPQLMPDADVSNGYNNVVVATNADLDKGQVKRLESANDRQAKTEIMGLAAHVRKEFQRAEFAKRPIENRMLKDIEQRNGTYSTDQLTRLNNQGGSRVFIPLTGEKCRNAKALLSDLLAPTNGKPWRLEPTPVPELPENLHKAVVNATMKQFGPALEEASAAGAQLGDDVALEVFDFSLRMKEEVVRKLGIKATAAAEAMEEKIEDQMVQGRWAIAFDEFLDDLVTFPSAFIKGPVLREREKLKWVPGPDGKPKAQVQREISYEHERVSPFDIYPSPEARGINDCEYLFHRMQISRRGLAAIRNVPGYDAGGIDLVLQAYGSKGYKHESNIDQDRAESEGRPLENVLENDGLFECLDFHGALPGWMLKDIGMKDIDNPFEEYEVNVWVIGEFVVRAVINPDPMKRRPFQMTSFEKVPGSFWGKSIPERMRDIQDICNSTVRALVSNMGLGSGPQVAINNINRLPIGVPIESMRPYMIWQFTNPLNESGKPIDFFQPEIHGTELLSIYDFWEKRANDITGIPSYAYGNSQIGQAGGTASGLSMLLNSTNKGLKQILANIDLDITGPTVTRLYDINMQHDPDQSIKGDCQVIARGALAELVREQIDQRRTAFLQSTANEYDMQILGVEGRANLLREVSKPLDMRAEVVPPNNKIMERLTAEHQAALIAEQQAAAQPNTKTTAA